MSVALGALVNVLTRLQVDMDSWSKSVAKVIDADETTAQNLSASVIALARIQTDIVATAKNFNDSVEVAARSLNASATSVMGLVQKDVTVATKAFSESIETTTRTLDAAVIGLTGSMSENIKIIEDRFARISDASKEVTTHMLDAATRINQLATVDPKRVADDARAGVR
jgi:phosphotransferase system HPr-like phosphotransfer protein